MLRSLLACCALASGLVAQFPTVVPAAFATTEGPGSSEAPGDWQPLHMQSIYHASTIATNGFVNGLAWRRDGNPNPYTAHSKSLTLSMSSTNVEEPRYTSAFFAYNRGADHVQVFTGVVNFPADPGVTMPPASFTVGVPFSSPYLLYPGLNLLIETVVQGTTFVANGWKGDATAGVAYAPEGQQFGTGSTGCPPTFRDNFLGNKPWPGAPLVLSSPSGAGTAPGIGVLGVAFPTPLDLAFLGAPQCALVQNLDLQRPVVSDAGGVVVTDWGRLPKTPSLTGQLVNLQTFVVDLAFNQLGLRASEGTQLAIGAGFPVTLDAHSWYHRRDTAANHDRADFRSSRTPVIELR